MATTVRPIFKHKPLPTLNSIRLVSVNPALQKTDAIVCHMMNADVEARQPYVALSYSWATEDGDDAPKQDIVIDEMTKSVGQSLFDALTEIRRPNSSILMWIDALCINQEDILERNQQVQQMAMIYAHAHEVVCWLGHSTPELDRAFFMLLDCASKLRSDEQHCDEQHIWNEQARTDIQGRHQFMKLKAQTEWRLCDLLRIDEPTKFPENFDHEEVEGLVQTIFAFLNRRYFRRRWVMQELLHSHGNAILRWGIYSAPWKRLMDDLLEVCSRLSENFWDLSKVLFHILYTSIKSDGQHMLQIWWDGSLLHMLARCDGLDCKDDRDRIYSLLALDSSKDPFKVVPDYAKSTRQVYIDFSKLLIQKGYQDWLFCNREKKYNMYEEDLNLPSWVFDLRYHLTAPADHLLDPKYSIPFSIGGDDVLTYTPYYFGTVKSDSGGGHRHFFTLICPGQPEQPAVQGSWDETTHPRALEQLMAELKATQDRMKAENRDMSEEVAVQSALTSWTGSWSKVEHYGSMNVYNLASEAPTFAQLQAGDLICGSAPDLRGRGTTVHILKKKENSDDDVYWLYRAWPVYENMEPNRFLSMDVRAAGRIKIRLA